MVLTKEQERTVGIDRGALDQPEAVGFGVLVIDFAASLFSGATAIDESLVELEFFICWVGQGQLREGKRIRQQWTWRASSAAWHHVEAFTTAATVYNCRFM